MERTTDYPWTNAVAWQPDEKLVTWLKNVSYVPDPILSPKIRWMAMHMGKVGHLVVTNQRLLFAVVASFIEFPSALMKKNSLDRLNRLNNLRDTIPVVRYTLNLEDINSISCDNFAVIISDKTGNLRAINMMVFNQLNGLRSHYLDRIPSWLLTDLHGMSPHSLKTIINETSSKRKAELRGEQGKVVKDFSWVYEYLDRGGIVVTTIKCPQCGAGLELPKSGTSIKCEYCNISIYVQDVLKKFKGLLKP